MTSGINRSSPPDPLRDFSAGVCDGNRQGRTRPQVIFWSIIGVSLVGLAVTSCLLSPREPTPPAIVFFGAVFLFCCLSGAWIGLGRRKRRFAVVVVPLLLGVFTAWVLSSEHELWLFVSLNYCIAVLVAVTLFCLRRFVGRFRRVAPGELVTDALRFGIMDLMVWTTIAAALIVIGKTMFRGELGLGNSEWRLVTIVGSSLAVVTVINIWAILGNRITGFKVAIILLLSCLAIFANALVFPEQIWFFPSVFLLCETITLSLLYCLRSDGYRLVKDEDSPQLKSSQQTEEGVS